LTLNSIGQFPVALHEARKRCDIVFLVFGPVPVAEYVIKTKPLMPALISKICCRRHFPGERPVRADFPSFDSAMSKSPLGALP
jgi:hypothetical protein